MTFPAMATDAERMKAPRHSNPLASLIPPCLPPTATYACNFENDPLPLELKIAMIPNPT